MTRPLQLVALSVKNATHSSYITISDPHREKLENVLGVRRARKPIKASKNTLI